MEISRLFNAYLDDFNKVTILLPKHYFNGKSSHFTILSSNEEVELFIEQTIDIGDFIKYITLLPTFIELGNLYYVKDEYGNKTDLQTGKVVRSPRFDTLYHYDQNDLGFTYTKDKTVFKLWSPTATKVELILINNKIKETFEMLRKPKGIYEIIINKDLDSYLYCFNVTNNNKIRTITDLYGIASNANSEYSAIIDKNNLVNITELKPNIKNFTDAIIYEMSIRDFTFDKYSEINNRGKYLGLTERNTKTENDLKTGIDYLIDLGVTHVQIMPFFDFFGIDELDVDKYYNWGYNPAQYNVPEGSFSTNPNDVYSRINELRKMISYLHENNIGVIMDVVYNHVFDQNKFPFDNLVPGYFYRYDSNGMLTNGSGCNNDIASERLMVRKFIIDSVTYWAKEYKIDGFRFDLMGLIDVDTMNFIRKALNDINPNILLYGEGWNMNTALVDSLKSTKENAYKLPQIGFFNDKYRDIIKGHIFDVRNRGFAFGSLDHFNEVKLLISGSVGYEKGSKYLFFEPYQTINYVECHDNLTMYDKAKIALENLPKELQQKHCKLATSIVLLSQGIPFIHSGQEFYRTKYGIDDSYNSPDKINTFNWKRAESYIEDIKYFKELVKVRKGHGAFRLNSAAKIKKHVRFTSDKGILIYELKEVGEYDDYNNIKVIINASYEDYVYKLDSDYKLIFDNKYYQHGKDVTNYLVINALSIIIIGK